MTKNRLMLQCHAVTVMVYLSTFVDDSVTLNVFTDIYEQFSWKEYIAALHQSCGNKLNILRIHCSPPSKLPQQIKYSFNFQHRSFRCTSYHPVHLYNILIQTKLDYRASAYSYASSQSLKRLTTLKIALRPAISIHVVAEQLPCIITSLLLPIICPS